MKKVFITGANGFIATSISNDLNRRGIETCGIDLIGNEGREIIKADLFEVEKWRGLLEQCDTIIHTAAIVSNAATEHETWRINVLGTQSILEAASQTGRKIRFMHFSSVAALGLKHTNEMNEDTPLRATGQKYSDSKLASEHLVLNYHNSGRVDSVIIRPADVYGPNSKPWVITPINMMKQNRFVVPKEGMFGPVYIDDLIEGCYLALTSPKSSGQIFILSGMGEVTNHEYFSYLAQFLGKKEVKTMPKSILYAVTYLSEKAAHLAGNQTELNPSSIAMLSRPCAQYSHAKATDWLGYQPKVSLKEGMRRCEEWFKA